MNFARISTLFKRNSTNNFFYTPINTGHIPLVTSVCKDESMNQIEQRSRSHKLISRKSPPWWVLLSSSHDIQQNLFRHSRMPIPGPNTANALLCLELKPISGTMERDHVIKCLQYVPSKQQQHRIASFGPAGKGAPSLWTTDSAQFYYN